MNKTLCPNGHFYDAGRFSACPLCEPSSADMQVGDSVADNQTLTTESSTMIMCINGHVFDPSLSSTCPICGAGAERTEISAPTPSMKKVMCSNGHLYDRNKHSVCPICGASPQEENPPQTNLTTFEQHMARQPHPHPSQKTKNIRVFPRKAGAMTFPQPQKNLVQRKKCQQIAWLMLLIVLYPLP